MTLVDTHGRGVERITRRGVVVDGRAYELDCLIFSTGFEVGTAYTRRAGYEITGRGGKTLTEHWARGLRTLHGFYSNQFPNCFHMGLTQNGFTANFPHMHYEQADHISAVLQRAWREGAHCVEPSAEAEQAWAETIRAKALLIQAFQAECTPGYYNNEGRLGEGRGITVCDELYREGD